MVAMIKINHAIDIINDLLLVVKNTKDINDILDIPDIIDTIEMIIICISDTHSKLAHEIVHFCSRIPKLDTFIP